MKRRRLSPCLDDDLLHKTLLWPLFMPPTYSGPFFAFLCVFAPLREIFKGSLAKGFVKVPAKAQRRKEGQEQEELVTLLQLPYIVRFY